MLYRLIAGGALWCSAERLKGWIHLKHATSTAAEPKRCRPCQKRASQNNHFMDFDHQTWRRRMCFFAEKTPVALAVSFNVQDVWHRLCLLLFSHFSEALILSPHGSFTAWACRSTCRWACVNTKHMATCFFVDLWGNAQGAASVIRGELSVCAWVTPSGSK